MASGDATRGVGELRASLAGSVATLLRMGGFAAPTGGRGAGRRGALDAGAGLEGAVSRSAAGALRDERGMRALAKEIKRLITEDARRGIGI